MDSGMLWALAGFVVGFIIGQDYMAYTKDRFYQDEVKRRDADIKALRQQLRMRP